MKSYLIQAEKERKVRTANISSVLLENFKKNVLPVQINLEIGCGHGHWLTSYAQEQPNSLYVGIDLRTKRIDKAKSKAKKRLLDNILFMKAEAVEFIGALNDSFVIHSTYLMYPDPWPKSRHYKRRLFNDRFLELLLCVTTSNSKLYFKTDHQNYYNWAKDSVARNSNWNFCNSDWPHHQESYFQKMLPDNYDFCIQKCNPDKGS